MSYTKFKLGTFANNNQTFVGMVIDQKIFNIDEVVNIFSGPKPTTTVGIQEMLLDWDVNFNSLCEIAETINN